MLLTTSFSWCAIAIALVIGNPKPQLPVLPERSQFTHRNPAKTCWAVA
ncbi:hypothetical protein [Anabaena azotica]